MDCSIWLLAFAWSAAGWLASAAAFAAFAWPEAGWPAGAAALTAFAGLAAGLGAGGAAGLCVKIKPVHITVMADKRNKPGSILAEVDSMEVNNVNSTAVLLASPVADAKQHVAPELTRAVKAVNGAKLFGQDSELSFVMDRETKRLVVRLVNKDTRKVIRQVPAEEVLRWAGDLNKP